MKIVEGAQYTELWRESRRGIPSASNAHKIITPTGKESAQQIPYICELIAEKFKVGEIDTLDGPATSAMRNGTAYEPEARAWYCLERGCIVKEVCLCIADDGTCCCSPDGLCGEDGGLELKCPQPKTHISYLLDPGTLIDDYRPQIHCSLVVTGRAWWDVMSYHPTLPPLLVRIEPDAFTAKLRGAMDAFYKRFLGILEKVSPK